MVSKLTKIGLPIVQNAQGFPPARLEWVWAEQVADGYRIDNVPFFADFVSGQVVSVGATDEGLVAQRVILNRSAERILLRLNDEVTLAAMKAELQKIGLTQETWASKRLLAVEVSAPAEIDIVNRLADTFGALEFNWRGQID